MAKVNVMKSSVEFSNDSSKVLLSKSHLPLVSGVISACSASRGGKLAAIGIARADAFTSLAVPAGYKSRSELVDIAKQTCQLAAGKGLLVQSGPTWVVNSEVSDLTDAIVEFVKDSDEFDSVKVDNKAKAVKVKKAGNSSNLKKFKVDTENGNVLVRLGRGKPSPYWTIVMAPEGSEGKKVNDSMKVHQTAADPEQRQSASVSRKAATSQALESVNETNAKLVSLVEALTAKVDALTAMVAKLGTSPESVSEPVSEPSEAPAGEDKAKAGNGPQSEPQTVTEAAEAVAVAVDPVTASKGKASKAKASKAKASKAKAAAVVTTLD